MSIFTTDVPLLVSGFLAVIPQPTVYCHYTLRIWFKAMFEIFETPSWCAGPTEHPRLSRHI